MPDQPGPGKAPYDSRPSTFEHIALVRKYLLHMAFELIGRAHVHDQSKLEQPELEVFDRMTPQLAKVTYGSDAYRRALTEMEEALEHHYSLNDHHPEHFHDGIAEMGLLEIMEMLCDWLAATARHDDGDIRRSIEKNAERFGYGDEIKRLLLNSLPALEGDAA